MSKTDPGMSYSDADGTERGGGLWLALGFAVMLVAAALALALLRPAEAENLVIGLLAALAVVGVFSIFAFAVGTVRVGAAQRDDLARAVLDGAPEAIAVVDADGRILRANRCYLELLGEESEPVSPERALSRDRDAAEAIYRLAQAARNGRALDEEVRLLKRPDGRDGPAWFRIRVAPLELRGRTVTVWTVADATAEREKHENAFQELQQAIDYLDHAPAGFFSVEPDGRIAYMNATLAEWLGHGLAEVAAAPLLLGAILPGDGAALLDGFASGAAGTRIETLDLDLVRRDGRRLPVRLLHKLTFTSDNKPSASRTLVLNRSPGEDVAESLRAVEVRFARFFNSAPVGIATVDRQGRIVRANAAFARFCGALLKKGEGRGRALADLVAERDRDAFRAALDAALAGRGAVEPVDAALAGKDQPDKDQRSGRFYLSMVEESEQDGEAAVVFAIDTTEQRALEIQFAQSQKMQAIGQLAGGIAHDFNNVLTAIIGYSDFLIASHKPADPSFQDIMQIKHNANRAAALVRQLLAFSRRQTLRPQVLALGEG